MDKEEIEKEDGKIPQNQQKGNWKRSNDILITVKKGIKFLLDNKNFHEDERG